MLDDIPRKVELCDEFSLPVYLINVCIAQRDVCRFVDFHLIATRIISPRAGEFVEALDAVRDEETISLCVVKFKVRDAYV